MLYIGEELGKREGGDIPTFDIAVDPLEGTTLTAEGKPGAITVIAFAPRGTFLAPPGTYMDQLAVCQGGKGKIDITAPLEVTIKAVAKGCGKDVREVTVAILERDRNAGYIDAARRSGARVVLFQHGTVSYGLAPALNHIDIDIMAGIGGAPEAVITAAGLKVLGGDIQAVLKPHNEHFKKQALEKGMNLDRVYTMNDLVKGDAMFVATGVSSGPILRGVSFQSGNVITRSVVMRLHGASRTVRFLESHYLG